MKNIKTKPLHTILIILLCLLTSLSVSADFQKGLDAYNGADYATALREWKPLAEQGYALAQYNLALMYANGEGVPEDDKEAVKWFRLAAEQSHASAQFNLGLMYAKGKGVPEDDKEAVKWYRLAAEQSHASAQNNLGVMYANGEGVPEDDVYAYMWWNLAAEQGHKDSSQNKNILSKEMTSSQIEEAQRLSRECMKKDYKNC